AHIMRTHSHQLMNHVVWLLVTFTEDKAQYEWRGYLYAVLLFVTAVLQSLLLQQYFSNCFLLGMRVRTAITAAVYKKALVVSNAVRKESTVGEIVNLMSADAQRFNDVTNFIHLLWGAPLQIMVSLIFLWQELGPSVLAGMGVIVLLIPINGMLAIRTKRLQVTWHARSPDTRMKLMTEILNGMKILKFYAWEPSFEDQVLGIRNKELRAMKKSSYIFSVSILLFTCTPFLISLVSFAVYVAVDPRNILDAQKAFTSIALFNILRFPIGMLPMVISSMVQANVSCKRLEKFLSGKDADNSAILRDPSRGTSPWVHQHHPLGSDPQCGSVAYVPQQAWVLNDTLRGNVLFGKELEEARYQKVLEACALLPDLDLLPGGDQTEIGEKGINLSGGQKQRVSLARAVYSMADIIILDDPLSAVDTHVGKHIFNRVIGPRGLLQHRTRVLVTHGLTFLPHVDQIVVLEAGAVSEVGTFAALRVSHGAFANFLVTYSGQSSSEEEWGCFSGASLPSMLFSRLFSKNKAGTLLRNSVRSNMSARADGRSAQVVKGQRLIEKETMETGQVRFAVYLQYLRSVGWLFCLLISLMYVAQNVAAIGQNLWLSDWTNDAITYFNQTYPTTKRDQRIAVFGALGIAQGVFVFLAAFFMTIATIAASRSLHASLLQNILRAPMVFFDTTPTGRIINRFAKVTLTPRDLKINRRFTSWQFVTVFVICLATPYFTAIVVPLAVFYYFIQRFYVCTSRQLRRLDSVTRSPIYSHFGETVAGLSVIRAYGHQQLNITSLPLSVSYHFLFPSDVPPSVIVASLPVSLWLAIRLELVGNLVVFFSALFAVIARDKLDSGLVGLSISYALNVTQVLNWLVRQTAELETNIVSVERVSEYTRMQNEGAWVSDCRPPQGWPVEGRIQFVDYKARYRPELELVLHGLSSSIASNEKVIACECERDGCKSSLFVIMIKVQSSVLFVNVPGAKVIPLTVCLCVCFCVCMCLCCVCMCVWCMSVCMYEWYMYVCIWCVYV
uniref:ABC-type glutathione-S-conjugate transporter n=1 Tax=Callorhinchus milii TaxID=7868 RepID=A0A4W3ID60_CALMI